MTVSVDRCRQVLASSNEYPGAAYLRIYVEINNSGEEKFELLKELLEDLNSFYLLKKKKLSRHSEARTMYSYLTNTVGSYTGISRNDFINLIQKGNVDLLGEAVRNPNFPIELLFNRSAFGKYADDINFGWLQEKINLAMWSNERFHETVNYIRRMIPNSEVMSDEMIMSIVGYSEEYEAASIINEVI
jgi:hypothetical protein